MKKQAQLLIVAAAGIIVVGLYFGYQSLFRTKCDGLFEQASDQLRAHFEVIRTTCDLVIGRDKVQELTEGAQKVALNLKACCLGPRGGSLDAVQFQACLNDAHDYESRVVEVSRTIKEAEAAREQGNAPLAAQKAEQAKQAASAALGAEKALGTRVEAVGAVTVGTPAKSSALALGEEREPNDHITAANRITVGTTIRGQLTTDEDRDFFAFKTSAQSAGRIRVILRKRFNAHIVVYDAAERQLARDGEEGDTPVSLSFESRPNADYYVLVKSDYAFGVRRGDYELVVREEMSR